MSRMQVIVVGGFLGAGKTTLLARAARHFAAQGKRVGIITNDQASNLVDTHFLAGLGIDVKEVAGGCFCCRFEDFERTAGELFSTVRPDVLLSEPVGSCTDISATVLQPMKQQWGGWTELSPFCVLCDARRLRLVLDEDPGFPESVRYIIRKQIEEADYLVVNKIDRVPADGLARLKEDVASAWPGIGIFEMSALHNRGVAEWLDAISGAPDGGRKIIDVDYDTYAGGEAELGWLNASVSLFAPEEIRWDEFARKLIGRIHGDLAAGRAEIGHLKLLISNANGQVVANSTSVDETPSVRDDIGANAGPASLIVNARARIEPEALESIVRHALAGMAGEGVQSSGLTLLCFKPAYPKPTHRLDRVVVAGHF